ncbi:MAG: hypothetical protein AAF581_06390 [Planctomycetota bacterium]
MTDDAAMTNPAPSATPNPAPNPPNNSSHTPSARRSSGAEALFLIGAATMMLELLWVRQWARVLGSDLDGVAVVLSAFLLGSGAGCLLGSRLPWTPRQWLAGAFCCGLLTTLWGGSWLPAWSQGWDSLAALPVRILVSTPIAVTALCLAAAIPAWFRVATEAANTKMYTRAGLWTAALDLGSALGALATPLALLPIIGATGAAGCALLILVAAWFLPFASSDSSRRADRAAPGIGARHAVAFCVGAIAFALQVVWSRLLGEVLGTSVLILGCAAAASLVGGAIGCRVLPWLAQRFERGTILATTWYSWLAAQGASALAIAWLPEAYLHFAEGTVSGESLTLTKGVLVVAALLPPAVASGFIIPALAAGWSRDVDGLARETGVAQGAGFCGGGVGALCAGVWWIPAWGSGATLWIIAVLSLTAAALLASAVGKRALLRPAAAVLLVAAGTFGALAHAKWDNELLGAGVFQWSREDVAAGGALAAWREREILYSGEGNLARVSIERVERTNTCFLRVGGRVEGSVPIRVGEPSNADLPTEMLLGILPALEAGTGGETLVIGVGGGTTVATAVTATAGPVTAFEVEGEVLAALRSPAGIECFPWEHERLFGGASPPTLIVEDARAYLHRNDKQWQAIVCQPSEPWLPWSAPLFTADFYRLVAARLVPGGAAVHWVQLYRIEVEEFAAIVSAFCSAFERVRVFHPPGTGEVILVGGGVECPPQLWQERWESPGVDECRQRVGWGDHPPTPIIAGQALTRWLEARGGGGSGDMQAQLEYRLPLVGDRGDDRSGDILTSLKTAEGK